MICLSPPLDKIIMYCLPKRCSQAAVLKSSNPPPPPPIPPPNPVFSESTIHPSCSFMTRNSLCIAWAQLTPPSDNRAQLSKQRDGRVGNPRRGREEGKDTWAAPYLLLETQSHFVNGSDPAGSCRGKRKKHVFIRVTSNKGKKESQLGTQNHKSQCMT